MEPVFFDDGRTPGSAVRQCNAQAQSSFLIYAVAGAEQIKACATSDVLRRGNVPYLSAGVTQAGLASLQHYFATTPTYEQQAPLIVRAARDGGFFTGKWAVVTSGDYAGARASISAALTSSKATFDPDADTYTVEGAPRDCSALGSAIRQGGYSTIYFLTPQPAFFAQCVGVIGHGPTYTGPGATFGYNSLVSLPCSASQNRLKAVYLHPVTGLDKAAERAPGRTFGSDVEYQVYAAMQTLETALNLVPVPLTREKLVEALRPGRLADGIAPGAVFNQSPFGGKAAYALRARCGGSSATNTFQTLKRYDR